RTSMPAAEASASTLETAPPCPTATGTLAGGGPGSWGPAGGAVAPTETTAAETARTVSFRATGRRMRTSGEGPLAQPTTSPCSRQERLAGRCGDAAPVPRAAGGGPRPSRALVRHPPAGVGRTRVCRGPLACAPMTDDIRNVVLGVVIAAVVGAALGWMARTYLCRRRLRRAQACFGLPENAESLLVVNRDPATAEPAVHRFDVFSLLELSALIKECGANVQVVTQDTAHQGFGERTEFCVGGPGTNRRMVAHMAAMLP